jgi:hypothetical protein
MAFWNTELCQMDGAIFTVKPSLAPGTGSSLHMAICNQSKANKYSRLFNNINNKYFIIAT